MGVGTNNLLERVGASLGNLNGVSPDFQPVVDVPYGGVLFALPALLSVGLLNSALILNCQKVTTAWSAFFYCLPLWP